MKRISASISDQCIYIDMKFGGVIDGEMMWLWKAKIPLNIALHILGWKGEDSLCCAISEEELEGGNYLCKFCLIKRVL